MSKVPAEERITDSMRRMLDRHGIASEALEIMQFSLLNAPRLCGLIRAVDMTRHLQGCSAEIGCAAGGTSRLMARLSPNRTHFACDTFVGLMDVNGYDGLLQNGQFSNRLSKLEGISERLSDLENVRIVPGYFPESATERMNESDYAVVHIDVDTYQSIRNAYEFFKPRMLHGGVMVFDDVIGRGTEGGKRFWQELQQSKGFTVIEENDPQVVIRIDG